MKHAKFLRAASAALMIVIVVTLVLASAAWAQTKFKTLYKFKGGKDGAKPMASLIFDQAGNLYGTTYAGGVDRVGTVFKLAANANGTWSESVLYSFCSLQNCLDGFTSVANLIFDAAGNLYGTTNSGGSGGVTGDGTVFKLTPNADGSWTESVLHSFNGSDGAEPAAGLIFDAAGNLYGTTFNAGGPDCDGFGCGTVFKLAPNGDGSWTESVLHSFNGSDGANPDARLIFDAAGNLYGTTQYGGRPGYGVVFQLTPNSDGSWTENVLHQFARVGNRGLRPSAGLTFDHAGNLYGTALGGVYGYGVVFQLTPNANGSWTESVLHSFNGSDGAEPVAGLIFDAAGNLYGTTGYGGDLTCNSGGGCGVVFKLTPRSSGGWTETVLHRFTDHPGAHPIASLTFDAAGNLYGTTVGDDSTTSGTVFEITP